MDNVGNSDLPEEEEAAVDTIYYYEGLAINLDIAKIEGNSEF